MQHQFTKLEAACANTVLGYFFNVGKSITHMKLQKLYYFSAGQYIAKYNNQVISEHRFQAWPHGPVLPNLYSELSYYGDKYIPEYIKFEENIFYYNNGIIFDTITNTVGELRNYTAWQLSAKSHAIGGPWYQTLKEYSKYQTDIDWDIIKKYFENNPIVPL